MLIYKDKTRIRHYNPLHKLKITKILKDVKNFKEKLLSIIPLTIVTWTIITIWIIIIKIIYKHLIIKLFSLKIFKINFSYNNHNNLCKCQINFNNNNRNKWINNSLSINNIIIFSTKIYCCNSIKTK